MPTENLNVFRNKRVLLLQGPVGPFFKNFARDLEEAGAQTMKINFNAGDEYFYSDGIAFNRPLNEWASFLHQTILQQQTNIMVMFGDCRPIHIIAKHIAQQLGIQIYVFEEGYLRPNHITLEQTGVNGFSLFANKARVYLDNHSREKIAAPKVRQIGKTYWHTARLAFIYYWQAAAHRAHYPHYQHHRPLTRREGFLWLRGAWRKYYFKFKERGILARLTHELAYNFYLVPLQVHNDFQIVCHSPYEKIEQFIREVIMSFARHAPAQRYLVFKQHPFDRAYRDYTALIEFLSREYGVSERVLYIHDQHLPTLLRYTSGVVVINSTVGLSAVKECIPVKVCGDAVYNLPQLTVQTSLHQFWQICDQFRPNKNLINLYLNYLCRHTQHNGSFYRKIKNSGNHSGVLWSK